MAQRHAYGALLRGSAMGAALLGGLFAPAVFAESAEERMQRLESEIRELRQMLEQERAQRAADKAVPAPPPAAAPASAAAPDMADSRRGADIRYYIGDEPFTGRPPEDIAPAVQGRYSELETLSFDPATYDVPGAGIFSSYGDPSSYRYVGLDLSGDLPVRQAGDYEFVVYPKPAREGGTSVETRMSVYLSVDGEALLEFDPQSSWNPRRARIHLASGVHRVRLWAVASSDGFGPSPTQSRLELAVKAPGDVAARPLNELRPAR